jgi:hypothetical protein
MHCPANRYGIPRKLARTGLFSHCPHHFRPKTSRRSLRMAAPKNAGQHRPRRSAMTTPDDPGDGEELRAHLPTHPARQPSRQSMPRVPAPGQWLEGYWRRNQYRSRAARRGCRRRRARRGTGRPPRTPCSHGRWHIGCGVNHAELVIPVLPSGRTASGGRQRDIRAGVGCGHR